MKKNENINNSFFIKSMDVYRAVINDVFLYGCFDTQSLADKHGYQKDYLNKNIKRFYDMCFAQHIGNCRTIKADKKPGAVSKAPYLSYQRFGDNNNFLYAAYLCYSFAKQEFWKYTIIRQYIYKRDCIKNDNNNKSVLKGKIDPYKTDEMKRYFGLCFERNYESVFDFLCLISNEKDISDLTVQLKYALSLFGRKAPYTVPAYSIARKIRKAQEEYDIGAFDREIWDFTYDNYDTILLDDTVYLLIQAIKNKWIISYTRSYGDKDTKDYVIPLKIMREFYSGRTYLITGQFDSTEIKSIRVDNIFKLETYEVNDPEYEEHLKLLKEAVQTTINSMWTSANYLKKGEPLSVNLEKVNKNTAAYIKKYAPLYKLDAENKTAQLTFLNVSDVNPFIKRLGCGAVISSEKNKRIFEELSSEYSEIRGYYYGWNVYITDCNETESADNDENHNNCCSSNSAQNINKYVKIKSVRKIENKHGIHLFNRYSNIFNIVIEDVLCALKIREAVDIKPTIDESLERCGFSTDIQGSYYNRLLERFINDIQVVTESENEDVGKLISVIIIDVNRDHKGNITKIMAARNNSEDCNFVNDVSEKRDKSLPLPAQLLTDYEYEYLWFMLKDPESRSLIDCDVADKMEKELAKHFFGRSFDDVFITRYVNAESNVDTECFGENIRKICKAIHKGKKITFRYVKDEKSNSYRIYKKVSPYRLYYSLRERVPRLIFRFGDEKWTNILNIDRMKDIELLEEESVIDEETIKKFLNAKKKYIEIVIHKNKKTKKKNVFERALRVFSSYEKYTWDDNINNDYVIAVVYYEFDVLRYATKDRKVYNFETIVGDILSLGMYAEVLPESRFDLPEKNKKAEYDTDMYMNIRGIYRNLDKLYNNENK